MQKSLETPKGRKITLTYLESNKELSDKGLMFLHYKRSTRISESQLKEQKIQYSAFKQVHISRLFALTGGFRQESDCIVTPPSSQDDAIPYLNKFLGELVIDDFTNRFSRKDWNIRACDQGTGFETLLKNTTYEAGGDESGIKSLIIVDDIYATGKTVDTILELMFPKHIPTSAKIDVVAPLRIVTQS